MGILKEVDPSKQKVKLPSDAPAKKKPRINVVDSPVTTTEQTEMAQTEPSEMEQDSVSSTCTGGPGY